MSPFLLPTFSSTECQGQEITGPGKAKHRGTCQTPELLAPGRSDLLQDLVPTLSDFSIPTGIQSHPDPHLPGKWKDRLSAKEGGPVVQRSVWLFSFCLLTGGDKRPVCIEVWCDNLMDHMRVSAKASRPHSPCIKIMAGCVAYFRSWLQRPSFLLFSSSSSSLPTGSQRLLAACSQAEGSCELCGRQTTRVLQPP